MKRLMLIGLFALAGCGGGGDDPAPTPKPDPNVPDLNRLICEGITLLFGGECRAPEPPPDYSPPPSSAPRLSAEEPVSSTVRINWVAPEVSWEAHPPPFVSGFVIRLSEWNGTLGAYYRVDEFRVNDPHQRTYVVDIPRPGRWAITMTAISSYTGDEGPGSGYVQVDIAGEEKPVAPALMELLDPAPSSPAVVLDWMPPVDNENATPLLDLTGYTIYFGQLSGIYTDFQRLDNPGLTTYVLDLPSEGTWYIAMTAVNARDMESAFSNELIVSVGGAPAQDVVEDPAYSVVEKVSPD